MAEISRPWSGTATGDAGPYSDDQWTDVWKTLMAHVIATQGVFQDQLNTFALAGLAASPVTIDTGRALVNGIWYESDASVDVAIPTPAANPRVDRIVLRADWVLQTVRITRIAGAEAATPVPPALIQIDGTTWDLPLWQVFITVGGVISIYADERDFVGQYEPLGVSSSRVYFEEDFFAPNSGFASGSFIGPFNTLASSGNVAVNQLDGLAGFGTGGLAFVHTAAGGGGDDARIESRSYKPDLMNARMVLRAKVPNTDANIDKVMGFVATGATLVPADGVYFRCAGAANWFAVCRAGGVETPVDTGQAQDDTWREFKIRQTSTDVVEFLIDGVVVATIQTNIPSDVDLDLNVDMFDNGAVPGANLEYLHLDFTTLRGTR